MTEAEKIIALLTVSSQYDHGQITHIQMLGQLQQLGEEEAANYTHIAMTDKRQKLLFMATYIVQNLDRFPELKAKLAELE